MMPSAPSPHPPAFDAILRRLGIDTTHMQQRLEGAAFLKVAKSAYPLDEVIYMAFNIPIGGQSNRFMQCVYSDQWLKNCITYHRARIASPGSSAPACQMADDRAGTAVIPLRTALGEFAFMCISADPSSTDWLRNKERLARDFLTLGSYFHQHMLRIWGHDTASSIAVSLRELECLRWIAEGKTAWEAGVILGISERTVRFHLNAAREKLDCQTTTQAVAKAVAQQLFAL